MRGAVKERRDRPREGREGKEWFNASTSTVPADRKNVV